MRLPPSFLGASFLGALLALANGAPVTLFVSSSGSDSSGDGSAARPWASFGRAQLGVQAVRAANKGALPGPVVVSFAPGTYYLNETIVLTPADSGDSPEVSVTYQGFGAVLSGGTVLFPPSPPARADLAGAALNFPLPASIPCDGLCRQMWGAADGQRRLLSRTPIQAYTAFTDNRFVQVPPAQLPFADVAQTLRHGEVVLYHSWTSSINTLAGFVASNASLELASPQMDTYNTASGNRYFVQNLLNASAIPAGQLSYDPDSHSMWYAPLPGEDPSKTGLVLPRLNELLVSNGNASAGLVVQFVNLVGFEFAHTASSLSTCLSEGCDGQSIAEAVYAAVHLHDARSMNLTNLTIAHTGGYGLWLHEGVSSVVLSYLHLFDLGMGGVRIGVEASGVAPTPTLLATNNILQDSVLEDGGHVVEAGAGVLLQQAAFNTIQHNIVRSFRYTGVSVGWTWGYAPTSNQGNVIAFNLIHDIGMGLLSDMGCVYNLGIAPGTRIVNNICHDVDAYGYGGWGYYTDEGSSFVTLENNIVYNTKSAGFHQHYGENNSVVNNVIAFPGQWDCTEPGCDMAGVRSSQHPPNSGGGGPFSSFTFERNIVLLNNPNATLFYTTIPTGMNNMTLDYNVYWSLVPGATLRFPSTQDPTTFAEWQAEGKDVHSVVANPLFTNATNYDFSSLDPKSPALALGFVPIDTSTVGPRPF